MNDSENRKFLILLETSGNQNYIFSTNKLRENIGASELTYQVGTKWVLEIVGKLNNTSNLEVWKDSDRLRQHLLNTQLNPAIETSDKPVEIIIATSGKALLLSKEKETAREIIKQVTLKALKEAPGIDVCGVFVEFDWNKEGDLVKAVERVYRQFQKVHSQLPSPSMRFLQLPIIEYCQNSEFPASNQDALSEISYQKQQQKGDSLERLNHIFASDTQKRRKFTEDVNKLEKKFEEIEWLAVIHADGNGLGQIFLNFQNYLDDKHDPREYINKLREFSLALDVCTEKAFLSAIDCLKTNQNNELSLIPLILGGDDLTVICDGKYALNFTKTFLKEFEKETAKTQKIGEKEIKEITVIREIARKAFSGVEHLSACAGVAIIKPHFPFSVAYHLAEDLIKQAKTVKTIVTQLPCSAVDFHILYDSSDVQLSLIRDKLKINKNTILHNRPYVVTCLKEIINPQGYEWAKFHHWDKLIEKVKVLAAKDEEGKKQMPSSQAHELRAALFLGKEVADARYKLICDRYQDVGIKTLAGSQDSLFQTEPNTQLETTGLLDAIDVVEFI